MFRRSLKSELKMHCRHWSLLFVSGAAALQLSHHGMVPRTVAPARASPAVAISVDSPKDLQRREMDERIFGFNKALIDTVYEAICFAYPVTGSDRDFARFFVLEVCPPFEPGTHRSAERLTLCALCSVRPSRGCRTLRAPTRCPEPHATQDSGPKETSHTPNATDARA